MLIERPPKKPIPKGFVPTDTVPYQVRNGDNWTKVAEERGVNASDLIFLNFHTHDPAEINWYLHYYVGCPPAPDGRNRMFSSRAKPGIIRVPLRKITLPPITINLTPERVSADQLMIYATDESAFATLAVKFERESPNRNLSAPAGAANELNAILNRYKNLKQINFYTHGNVGYMHFDGGGITRANVAAFLTPHPALFSGEGRILFTGCNIGEGNDGRAFLIEVGQRLLRGHGGFVGGSTSKNVSCRWGLCDVHVPLWGDLRVIQLDENGNVIAERLF